jgi:hypothetical protein
MMALIDCLIAQLGEDGVQENIRICAQRSWYAQ